jgi:protein TonB
MEPKKNSNADLTNYRNLILGVSFLLSLSMIITAFEWKTYDDQIDILKPRKQDYIDDPVILRTEIPPPMPPAKPISKWVEMPDDKEMIDDLPDIDVILDTDPTPPLYLPEPPAIEPETSDEPLIFVEVQATPDGGFSSFYQDLANRIKYPAQARRMQVEGRVFVEFVINRDGSITEIKVLKGIGGGCDEEAVRVLKTSPRWKPGKQRGVPVRQRMVIPITFQLS